MELKLLTRIVNYASGLAAGWLIFYPKPYELALVSCITVVLMGFFLIIRYKGRISIRSRNDDRPSLSINLYILPIAISLRGLMDYTIVTYQNAWVYTILLTPIFYYFIARDRTVEFTEKNADGHSTGAILPALAIGGFLFFTIINLNCAFDNTEPQLLSVTVNEKKVTGGDESPERKLLLIGPNDSLKKEIKLRVRDHQYRNILIGDTVQVAIKPGLFRIPWVYLKHQ